MHSHHQSIIDKLPVELLSYIFALGVETGDGEVPWTSENSALVFPATISLVSKHWRAVSLSTPQLWTRICVTVGHIVVPSDEHDSTRSLNFEPIQRNLLRSRNAPIDIVIDARDPEWNFLDYDTPIVDPNQMDGDWDDPTSTPYTHPFSPAHMHALFDILLPNLHRWRSLEVLTDRWAPMHAALSRLSAPLQHPSKGAPLLERLELSRCNEFASYIHDFTPSELLTPHFVPFGALFGGTFPPDKDVLPRFKHLNLSGVHVDWSALPRLLPRAGLQTLELAYHCGQVRQTPEELHALLTRCVNLEELRIKVSGPLRDHTAAENAWAAMPAPVSLPHLQRLVLGYNDPAASTALLRALDAPQLHELRLEDAAPPENPDQDAACLLTYCGGDSERGAPFPHLERVTLQGVKACRAAFDAMFAPAATPNLKQLALWGTSISATKALRPVPSADDEAMDVEVMPAMCPCPSLESLNVRGHDAELGLWLEELVREREHSGAPLRDVSVEPASLYVGELADVMCDTDTADCMPEVADVVCDENGSVDVETILGKGWATYDFFSEIAAHAVYRQVL